MEGNKKPSANSIVQVIREKTMIQYNHSFLKSNTVFKNHNYCSNTRQDKTKVLVKLNGFVFNFHKKLGFKGSWAFYAWCPTYPVGCKSKNDDDTN